MPVIAFSKPDIRIAVEAIKRGASDYLQKPLTEDMLRAVISRYKKKIVGHEKGFDETMGTSDSMQSVYGLIKKAAVSESNVLPHAGLGAAAHRESLEAPVVPVRPTALEQRNATAPTEIKPEIGWRSGKSVSSDGSLRLRREVDDVR